MLILLSSLFVWNSPETVERGLDVYDEVKWGLTRLSSDPARRAKQLIRRFPIIGKSPHFLSHPLKLTPCVSQMDISTFRSSRADSISINSLKSTCGGRRSVRLIFHDYELEE